MSTPAAFTEGWVNVPAVPATVQVGGAGTVPPGGTDPWVMAGGYQPHPPAVPSPGQIPPSLFRVYDPALPAEAMLVFDATADPVWQVIRGDQGTPVLDHAPGFEVRSLISPAGLGALAAGVPSGNGLVMPRAAVTASDPWAGTVRHPVASLLVPAGEAVSGAAYEAMAWGWYTNPGTLNFELTWGATDLGAVLYNNANSGATTNSRWKIHSVVSVFDNAGVMQAVANSTVWLAPANSPDFPGGAPLRKFMNGQVTNPDLGARPIITSADQLLQVNLTGSVAGFTATHAGTKIWRAA
jgi:hypothetical protein